VELVGWFGGLLVVWLFGWLVGSAELFIKFAQTM